MKHTISVIFEHNFNALSRITGLFSGRGYRIDSISFGPGEEEGLARMTLTTHGDEHIIEQITKHLNRLVDVIKVTDLTYVSYVERELALIKISAPPSRRPEVMQIASIFRANIVDISPRTLTVEVTGKTDKINAMLELLRGFGILEVARTGCVALQREYQAKASQEATGIRLA
jgi:acetolactate synthase-1/3 small subunit